MTKEDVEKVLEQLSSLRGYHADGGCESCGWGSGWQSEDDGEYVQWDDVERVLEALVDA